MARYISQVNSSSSIPFMRRPTVMQKGTFLNTSSRRLAAVPYQRVRGCSYVDHSGTYGHVPKSSLQCLPVTCFRIKIQRGKIDRKKNQEKQKAEKMAAAFDKKREKHPVSHATGVSTTYGLKVRPRLIYCQSNGSRNYDDNVSIYMYFVGFSL